MAIPTPVLSCLTREPQFAVICIRSATQTFVLQTQPAEPALDLYFSVCVWTPRPCRWKLMSSPSPGIQSERGNYTAIWSSSALQSQQIIPLQQLLPASWGSPLLHLLWGDRTEMGSSWSRHPCSVLGSGDRCWCLHQLLFKVLRTGLHWLIQGFSGQG